MTTAVILFEDHSAAQFRPLSWTVPVYEMGCGLFNLRERVGMILEDEDIRGGLLPRSVLQPLQDLSVADRWVSGFDAVTELATGVDRLVMLNGRCSLRGEALRELVVSDIEGARSDDDGILCWSGSADDAAAVLDHWQAWDARVSGSGAWVTPGVEREIWSPQVGEAVASDVGWRYLWDRIHDVAPAIVDDARDVAADGRTYRRWIFGVDLEEGSTAPWAVPQACRHLDQAQYPGVSFVGGRDLWAGDDVRIDPGVVLDVRNGPIVLESAVRIEPNAVLHGPLTIGAGSTVKAGTVIYGETSIGPVCKMSGEIAESQIAAYANKQHAGFLGHAIIGSWVNLGADTTCSDLKNNYGQISVNYGDGPIPTGTRFLGLMMAEHAKSAIGTTFNTATTVGVSANVFAAGFPRAVLPNFAWGDGRGRRFQVARAIETAAIVMGRRGVRCTEAHARLLTSLYDGAATGRDEQTAT